jgi:hypothetical protein
MPGETKHQRKEREKLAHMILDLGGIPRVTLSRAPQRVGMGVPVL